MYNLGLGNPKSVIPEEIPMIRRTLTVFGILGLALVWTAPARGAITTSEDLQRVCEDFYKLDLDPSQVRDVAGLTLVKDIGTIRLTEGTLFFSEALEGVIPMAVFLGKGSFTLTPVRKMDREMLNLSGEDHLNAEMGGMVNTTFTQAFFISYDTTWQEIEAKLAEPRTPSADEIEKARKILKDELGVMDAVQATPEHDAIEKILHHREAEASFMADLKTADHGWLTFIWNPAATYEVLLVSRQPVGSFYMGHPLVVTHRKSDLDRAGRYVQDPWVDLHEALDVTRYRMNLEIPDLETIKIDIDVTFETKMEGLKLVDFNLVNDIYVAPDSQGPRWDSRAKWIDVLSATDSSGNELPFVHRKNQLLVLPAEGLKKGEETTYNFQLLEKTITQLSDVHFALLNTYAWFPRHGYLGGQSEFDWTVKTVKPLMATGSGNVVKRWEEEDLNAVQMVSERPVWVPSLIFGQYKVEEAEYSSKISGRTVKLATYYWPKTTYQIMDEEYCQFIAQAEGAQTVRCPVSFELDVPPRKPKNVLEEGQQILEVMEELYGPYPYEKLDIAMMAPFQNFGQAPPSFVQLTGEAFMSPNTLENKVGFNRLDFLHGFYSHEIAHQWWGHKIGFTADEDQWLSESFAEYSAGLFVLAYQGETAFKKKMEEWKEWARIGDPHGSIAWSNRVSGTMAGAHRTGLIYNKGAYVIHMLRMLLGMDKYKKAMQTVFAKHGYMGVTTNEFQRACEEQAGYSLDFFFDQWFRGTGIPVFDYSWDSQETDDGKHLVTINISQRDKENFKQVLMPVYLYFKGTKEPMIRPRPITTADHVYKLKLPQKPVRIILDEDKDILGDMIPQGSGM
jgi:hypothetical protein